MFLLLDLENCLLMMTDTDKDCERSGFMSFGQRMNMCNITFIVSSFGIFRILNVFKQLEKMCIGEMTVLENGFCHYPDFVEAGLF